MSKHNIIVKEIATKVPNKILEVSIFYDKGGINYFSGSTSRRGYYISVTPITIVKHEGYTSRSITLFCGIKQLLVEASRFSEKQLNGIAHLHSIKWNDIADQLVTHIVVKENIPLAD